VGTDDEQRQKLLAQLAVRRHAVTLATIELRSPWEELIVDPVHGVDKEERSPEQPDQDEVNTEDNKLSTEQARAAIEKGWATGLTVRDTAALATRAPSFVHNVFVKLDTERGPRPMRGQLALLNRANGQDVQADADADGSERRSD